MNAACFRIASYNLQKCVGLDMRRRPGRSLSVIGALRADLVVLQEADKRLPPRPAALPHDMVAQAGWTALPFGASGAALGGSLGWHGNAMLARPGVKTLRSEHLDLPGLEPRGAILAELGTAIGPLRVIGLHLGLVRRYRRLQVAAIERRLRQLPPMATVWAGDFNEWGKADTLLGGIGAPYFAPLPASFPALRPVARLDRIAHCDRLRVCACNVLTEKPAHIASDHLPVWADLARME